jgi:hypothetical protein
MAKIAAKATRRSAHRIPVAKQGYVMWPAPAGRIILEGFEGKIGKKSLVAVQSTSASLGRALKRLADK